MDVLYGKTAFSFFDVWALVHFCFWVFFGSCVWALGKRTRWSYARVTGLFSCLALAFGWEGLEAYLAPRHPQLWGDWFTCRGFVFLSRCTQYSGDCHYESWWNSWMSDPLTCLVGVLLVWTLLDRRSV